MSSLTSASDWFMKLILPQAYRHDLELISDSACLMCNLSQSIQIGSDFHWAHTWSQDQQLSECIAVVSWVHAYDVQQSH